jgi:hypothetical protein
MRAAQIYLQTIRPELIEDIARAALMDPRIDQVMWRTVDTWPGADGYTVVTSYGRLEFAARPPGPNTVADAFGGHWSWSGDADAVDLQTDGGEIEFRLYPTAFERIAGVLDSEQSGSIWMTARAGCEFEAPGGKPHVGGASHGALHALDSLSPLLIAGGPARPNLPGDLRSIDIAPLCMQLLGLPMRYAPGAPRSAARRGQTMG